MLHDLKAKRKGTKSSKKKVESQVNYFLLFERKRSKKKKEKVNFFHNGTREKQQGSKQKNKVKKIVSSCMHVQAFTNER